MVMLGDFLGRNPQRGTVPRRPTTTTTTRDTGNRPQGSAEDPTNTYRPTTVETKKQASASLVERVKRLKRSGLTAEQIKRQVAQETGTSEQDAERQIVTAITDTGAVGDPNAGTGSAESPTNTYRPRVGTAGDPNAGTRSADSPTNTYRPRDEDSVEELMDLQDRYQNRGGDWNMVYVPGLGWVPPGEYGTVPYNPNQGDQGDGQGDGQGGDGDPPIVPPIGAPRSLGLIEQDHGIYDGPYGDIARDEARDILSETFQGQGDLFSAFIAANPDLAKVNPLMRSALGRLSFPSRAGYFLGSLGGNIGNFRDYLGSTGLQRLGDLDFSTFLRDWRGNALGEPATEALRSDSDLTRNLLMAINQQGLSPIFRDDARRLVDRKMTAGMDERPGQTPYEFIEGRGGWNLW